MWDACTDAWLRILSDKEGDVCMAEAKRIACPTLVRGPPPHPPPPLQPRLSDSGRSSCAPRQAERVQLLVDAAPVGARGDDGNHQGMAFFNREVTNSFVYSDTRGSFTVRVDVNGYGSAKDGRYLMKRTVDASSFDLWLAIRDATVWGDTTNMTLGEQGDGGSVAVNGFGSRFILRKISASADPSADFDPIMNDFTHESAVPAGEPDHSYMCWGRRLIHVLGNPLYVCRKMGLLCDGYGDEDDLWMVTSDPEQRAFKTDGENGETANIWVR